MRRGRLIAALLLAPALLRPDAGASYLTSEPSARARSSGGALAASRWGIESLRYNPAGLVGAPELQAYLTHYVDGQFWTHDGLGSAGPLAGGYFGVEALFSRIQPVPYYDLAGNEIGRVTAGSSAMSLAWARELGRGISAGVAAKVFGSQIDTYRNQGWAVDAGLQAHLLKDRLGLGVSVLNLGSQTAYIAIADPLPTGVKAGAEARVYDDADASLDLHLDVNAFPEARWMPAWQMGMEAQLYDRLSLAAGLRQRSQGASYSFGGGLKMGPFGFYYAFQPDEVLGASHLLSVTMQLPAETL